MKTIITLLLISAVVLCQAQDTISSDSTSVQELSVNPDFKYRDPGIAFAWSLLISGGGQFYNGQNGKAWRMLGISTAGVIVYVRGVKNSYNELISAGFFMMLGTGLYSLIDAPIWANKLNRKNSVSWNIQPAFKPINSGLASNTSAGLQLTFRF